MSGRTRPSSQGRHAFTLLEMIVVITIIGLLGSLVVLRVTGVSDTAKLNAANADMRTILNAAQIIETTTGRCPRSIDEMVEREDGLGLEEYPVDPWGGEYVYELENGRPRLRCLGSDRVEGGEGIAADLEMPRRGREPVALGGS